MAKKETLAQKIYDVLVGNGKPMDLQEINEQFADKPATTVRGRIYDNLHKLFVRLDRGLYWIVTSDNDGGVVVIEGNGRDLTLFADDSVDAIVTDHPWESAANVGTNRKFADTYDAFRYTLDDFREKARVLKKGHFLVEVLPMENATNYEYLYEIKQMAKECGLHYYAKIPWKKGTFVSNTGRSTKNAEDIMFFTKGKARSLRPDQKKIKDSDEMHYMSGTHSMLPTAFDFQPPSRKDRVHQAEKPVDLYAAILEQITLPGELVIDQFAGSGNLGKASLEKGRIAVLYEIMKENIQGMVERLNATPLLLN